MVRARSGLRVQGLCSGTMFRDCVRGLCSGTMFGDYVQGLRSGRMVRPDQVVTLSGSDPSAGYLQEIYRVFAYCQHYCFNLYKQSDK